MGVWGGMLHRLEPARSLLACVCMCVCVLFILPRHVSFTLHLSLCFLPSSFAAPSPSLKFLSHPLSFNRSITRNSILLQTYIKYQFHQLMLYYLHSVPFTLPKSIPLGPPSVHPLMCCTQTITWLPWCESHHVADSLFTQPTLISRPYILFLPYMCWKLAL